ncbi:MAG: xanthine dehydrogenase family protein molybdopterin-binding subunit [Pseudomonadales bacterium]
MAHIRALRSGVADQPLSLDPFDSTLLPAWETAGHAAGRAHVRVEARAKVTGAARYSGDVRLPGQLHAGILRSRVAHGVVADIDTTAAQAMNGVHAVLCHRTAPDIAWQRSRLFDPHVRFVRDEVAAVAAESPQQVEDALEAIRVTYQRLPHVLDADAAEAEGAPHLYADGNHREDVQRYQRGDVTQGFAEADVVVDQIFTTQAALHNCMETHGCTAAWQDGQLTLWESTQGVYDIRDEVARHLGLPASAVRVITEHMGGGFGSKLVMWKHSLIAALLARTARRPVQLMLDRRAENLAAGNRNPSRQHVRLGARYDGTLTAIDMTAVAAVGANAVGGESSNVSGIYERLYRCDNVRTEQRAVHTNLGPSCAFRAPGFVEGAFALESAMDALSRELDMDPVALRLANYTGEDQVRGLPYSNPDGLRGCYQRAVEAFRSPDAPHLKLPPRGIRRGIGVAAHDWGGGGHPPAYAWAKLNGDGSLEVVTGTQDIGTGTRTALTQIAAEELGVAMDRVTLRLGDSAAGPFSPVSGGSATLATLGPAVRAAVADLGARLTAAVAADKGVAATELVRGQGEIRRVTGSSAGSGDDSGPWSLAELARSLAPRMITGEGRRSANPADCSVRTFGVHIVEVAVNVETGEITVERVVAAHDCGRVINPLLVDSQIMGGVIQGLGFALLEQRVVDDDSGVPLGSNLEDYLLPTMADVPEIRRAGASDPDPGANAIAAKGIGEPPMIPLAPALANAVYDAIGVRINDTPITRARVLGALARIGGGDRP